MVDWTKEHRVTGAIIIALMTAALSTGMAYATLNGRLQNLEASQSRNERIEESLGLLGSKVGDVSRDMEWVKAALSRLERSRP